MKDITHNMNNTLPIIRYKVPDGVPYKCLGRFASRLDFVKKEPYCIIYVDIERILKYCIDSAKLGCNVTFDQIFSHVFSHEYIHFLITTHVGNDESCAFDNIFGIMDVDPKYIYSGVKLEGEPLCRIPKRHFYTKLINSIRNIIGIEKKCN